MTCMTEPVSEQKSKKPWYLRWWAITIAAILVVGVIGAISNAVSGTPEPEPTATAVAEEPSETPAPQETPTSAEPSKSAQPAPEPAPSSTTIGTPPVEVVGPLSYTVWTTVVHNLSFTGGITTSSPLYPVTKIEDISSDTLRVYVQEDLTRDEEKAVARQIFVFGAPDNTDLQVVVVRDLSGVDKNFYRSDFPDVEQ